MTSETPESTSPITIIETEHVVRISVSVPITTDRTVESVQEQAVVEDLMDKQAYRIETSFMAAMDRFSSELRTLFQERMLVTSSVTPLKVGQRNQEHERLGPYGECSSLGASGRTQASGYGQHSQPPTNSWGQSQPTWVNPGPTYPTETACCLLHVLAVSLGQSSPTHSAVQFTPWASRPVLAEATRPPLRHNSMVRAIRPFHHYRRRYFRQTLTFITV
ncbi:unnamed protein product [Prunus brigantina]